MAVHVSEDDSAFADLGRRSLTSSIQGQLDELLSARDQMEKLLRVIVGLASDLNLDATLHRIVTAAHRTDRGRIRRTGRTGSRRHLGLVPALRHG